MNIKTQRLQQVLIEDKYSKKNIRDKVLSDIVHARGRKFSISFEKAITLVDKYLSIDSYYNSKLLRIVKLKRDKWKAEELVMEVLIVVMEHEGAQPIQSAAGKIANILNYENIFDGIKTASELLATICYADLYDIIPAKNSKTGSLMVKSNFKLEEETLQFIANTKYLPPMITEPDEITCNTETGYLTQKQSIILGKQNHHDNFLALDAINIANSIALSLDRNMLRFNEVAKKPLDTPEKVANHRRMVNASKVVYKELITAGNKFYLTWRPDKRGRIYSQGYHVNLQSTSYKKAIINLHEKHLITGV